MADPAQIRHLLDNPDVPADTKKELVRALYSVDPRGGDLERYASANRVALPDGFGRLDGIAAVLTSGLSIPVSNAHDDAGRARFQLSGHDVAAVVNRANGQADLARSGRALQDTGGVAISDQLLDEGAPGLRFFDTFLPVYPEAAQAAGFSGPPAPDLKTGVYGAYDEMRGIDFGAFRADAHRIDDVAEQATTAKLEMNKSFAALDQSWHGSAADAAARYHIQFFADGDTVVANTKAAAGPILAGITDIQTKVRVFAQKVHGLASDTCATQTVEVVRDNIRKAQGQLQPGDVGGGDLFHGVLTAGKDAFLGAFLGGPIGGLAGALKGAVDGGREARENIIEQAKAELASFCADFSASHQNLTHYCTTVQAGVQTSYDTMLGALASASEDPFGQLGGAPVLTGNGPGTDRLGNGRHKPASGPSGNGGHQPGGGESPPGGGGSPPGGGGNPPGVQQGGVPLPGMPTSAGVGTPQTVTIQADGGSTITVTSPDGAGHGKMSVDGQGSPRNDTVDVDGKGAAKIAAGDLDSYRGRMDAISAELRESQQAIAAAQQQRAESFAAQQAELTERVRQLGKQAEQGGSAPSQWAVAERPDELMSFGTDDEPPPAPRAPARRPSRPRPDEDFSEPSWLR